jgi:hypothetical protein
MLGLHLQYALHTTSFVEQPVSDKTLSRFRKRCYDYETKAPDVLADFEFNEDGTRLLKCAAGHVPISQSYTKSTRQCRVSFDRNHCAGCPYQEQCRPKIYKKVASFITSYL